MMTRILGTDGQAPVAIDASVVVFPANVQNAVIYCMQQTFPAGMNYLRRPLRGNDPNESIGVFPMSWNPEEDSYETRGLPQLASFPTVHRYMIMVQGYVKDSDEERGLARHAILAKLIRSMLYSSDSLALSLRALSVTLYGATETLSRYGVRTQRYISNDVHGSWLYLSNTEFWVETCN